MFRYTSNGRKRLRGAKDVLNKVEHLIQQLKNSEGNGLEWAFHPRSHEGEGEQEHLAMKRLQQQMSGIVAEDPTKWGFSIISGTDTEMEVLLFKHGEKIRAYCRQHPEFNE